MSEEKGLADLMTADTPAEAQIVTAVLRASGIPVFVAGALLQDEFAMSQMLLGVSGTVVQVPADRLEEARAALAEARALGDSDLDEA